MRARNSSLTRWRGSFWSTRATVEGCTPASWLNSFSVIGIGASIQVV